MEPWEKLERSGQLRLHKDLTPEVLGLREAVTQGCPGAFSDDPGSLIIKVSNAAFQRP